jgi:hypothetical protein
LAVLKSAGLVAERKQANKVIYSLVAERLTASLGTYLSAVCPDRQESNRRRKKKKPTERASSNDKAPPNAKASAKRKHKGPSRSRGPQPIEAPATGDDGIGLEPGPEEFSARE